MRLKSIGMIVFLLLLSATAAWAVDPGESFSHLKLLDLDGIRFYYRADSSRLINKPLDETMVRVMVTKVDVRKSDEYLVMFDAGPSEDPAFALYRIKGGKMVQLKGEDGQDFWVGGSDLILPGSGSFYVAGHINNMFDMRRKFVLDGQVVREVRQPFYYVGLDTQTTQAIKLFASTKMDHVVAYLPKGASVTVLINQGEYYLVKTPFGLVGWVKVKEYSYETPLEGVRYMGD